MDRCNRVVNKLRRKLIIKRAAIVQILGLCLASKNLIRILNVSVFRIY
jgi:hypothetical protein